MKLIKQKTTQQWLLLSDQIIIWHFDTKDKLL